MKKILNISLVAVLSVVPLVAHADIASKGYVDTQLDTKQDKLVSGTNIKTVGGASLLGSGNIAFPTVDQTYSATGTNAVSGAAVASAIQNKVDRATTLAGYGITDAATSAQGVKADTALQTVSQTGTGFVKSVSKNGTAVSVTAGALVASDIPNIAESQVTNLTADLAAKEAAANKFTKGTSTDTQLDSRIEGAQKDVSFPTIAVAERIAQNEAAKVVTSNVTGQITDLTGRMEEVEGENGVAGLWDAVGGLGEDKQDKIAAGTLGNVVTYSGEEGTVGSLGFDTAPTASSNNLVKSGAIKTYVDNAVAGKDTLSELTDTTITNAQNGQILKYNGTAWVNGTETAQVNADWTATTGKAQILNKPTLGSLAALNTVTSTEITDGTIVNADISSNAKIAPAKIDLGSVTQAGSSLQGTTADGTYTLTAKIENGVATLKWELISR